MKFVKFGIFALSLGFFVASCGNNTEEAATEEITTPEPVPAPVEEPVVDTLAPATTEPAPAQ